MKKNQQPIWSQRIAAVALGTAIWWNMGTAPEVVEAGASGNVAESVENATCEDAGMITLPDATCVNADPVNLETVLDVNPDNLIDAGFFADSNDSGEILYPPNYEPATDAELETRHGYDYASKPVREETVCEVNNGWVGITYFREDHILIQYNDCNNIAHGGDETDLEETREHERAHAAGWKHYQGTPATNPAYYAGADDPNFGDGK